MSKLDTFIYELNFSDSTDFTQYRITIKSENGEKCVINSVSDVFVRTLLNEQFAEVNSND